MALLQDFLTVREYIRLMYRPIDDYSILNGYHREIAEPFYSFIYRTRKIMERIGLKKIGRSPTCAISDLAPWVTVHQCVIIPDEENKVYSQIEFQAYVE